MRRTLAAVLVFGTALVSAACAGDDDRAQREKMRQAELERSAREAERRADEAARQFDESQRALPGLIREQEAAKERERRAEKKVEQEEPPLEELSR